MKDLLLRTAGILALCAACEEDPLVAIAIPDVLTDEFTQDSASQVDILWVVDNSTSMAQEQELLAENFERFINGLVTCGTPDDICDVETLQCTQSGEPCQVPNFHVGVVSADPADRGELRAVGLCAPQAGVFPVNDRFRYCQGRPTDCRNDGDPNADPDNDTCSFVSPVRFVTNDTPNGTDAFGQLVSIPLDQGAAREQGLAAAALAVGLGRERQSDGTFAPVAAPDENDGFLREEATLFVIFVSDESDSSFGDVSYHYRTFEGLKGAGNESQVSLSAIVGPPDPDGPADEEEGGCGLDDDDDDDGRTGQAGPRYVAASMYSRGREADVQVCDGQRLLCGSGQTCQTSVPDLPGLCLPSACQSNAECGGDVCDGGPCAICNDGTCEIPPLQMLSLLRQNGIYESICSDDYGPVLDSLGFGAAGLARKFRLGLPPDCTEVVFCCAEDNPDCEDIAEVCVRVDGRIVPNRRSDGWVYDSVTNAVFFGELAIPRAGASIDVSYRQSASGRALGCAQALNP